METLYNETMTVPEDHLLSDHSHDGSLNDKLYHMKSRSADVMNSMKRDMTTKMDSMKRDMTTRVDSVKRDMTTKIDSMKRDWNSKIDTWKPMAQERISAMRSDVQMKVSQFRMQLQSNPTKWAGIAAGAGFGVGLIGRIMRRRARNAVIPHLIIIESSC